MQKLFELHGCTDSPICQRKQSQKPVCFFFFLFSSNLSSPHLPRGRSMDSLGGINARHPSQVCITQAEIPYNAHKRVSQQRMLLSFILKVGKKMLQPLLPPLIHCFPPHRRRTSATTTSSISFVPRRVSQSSKTLDSVSISTSLCCLRVTEKHGGVRNL